jgi:hypothetical protein
MSRTVGFRFQAGTRRDFFFFFLPSLPGLGPIQPPIQWVPGALSPWVKRSVREADHSPPSSAEVKNAWSYTSISVCLHGVVFN